MEEYLPITAKLKESPPASDHVMHRPPQLTRAIQSPCIRKPWPVEAAKPASKPDKTDGLIDQLFDLISGKTAMDDSGYDQCYFR